MEGTYALKWEGFTLPGQITYTDEQSIKPIGNGIHSGVYIHPVSTQQNVTDKSAFLTGCKALCFESDAKIGNGGVDIFSAGGEFKYALVNNQFQLLDPSKVGNKIKADEGSYKAHSTTRKIYLDAVKTDAIKSFELKVVINPSTPAPTPSNTAPSNTAPSGTPPPNTPSNDTTNQQPN